MYGQKAIELVRDIQNAPGIPTYSEDGVRNVIKEINALFDEVKKIIRADGEHSESAVCSIVVHHAAIQRNKQCVLAYLNERMNRIKRLRWEVGSVIPAEMVEDLSPQEQQFFSGYNKLVNKYARTVGIDDMTADLKPPKDNLYVEVRCLEDLGEIRLEDGVIQVKKDNQFFVRRSDVEQLIKQGAMVEIGHCIHV
eukprot:Colp12_sorted_trinity150504_noHs@26869